MPYHAYILDSQYTKFSNLAALNICIIQGVIEFDVHSLTTYRTEWETPDGVIIFLKIEILSKLQASKNLLAKFLIQHSNVILQPIFTKFTYKI